MMIQTLLLASAAAFGGAKWISCGDAEVTPRFERTFEVGAGLKSATLAVTAPGFYVAEMNGARVGDRVLDPAPTDYTKRVLYSTYDVGALLKPGANTLALTLGHGWFCVPADSGWGFDLAPWRDVPCGLAKLTLKYADGREQSVVTDETWREAESGILFDAIREGEIHGLPAAVGRPPRAGRAAQVAAGPKGALEPEPQPPARVTETFRPKAIHDLGDGRWFVDFGVNIAGWCRLTVRGLKAGDRVDIAYDERSEDGVRPPALRHINQHVKTFGSTNLLGAASAFQTDHIFARGGAADETYEPHFVYHGFQYVTVSGLKTALKADDIVAKVVHTDFRRTGTFRCSHADFNRLMAMTDRSYRSNWTDGVPTDCPHREKNGWTGDASMASEVGQYFYENTAGYRKWITDLIDAQRIDGMIPGIVPTGGWGCDFSGWGGYPGPCWDGALPVITWVLYVYRGDRADLEKAYPAIVRSLDFWEKERSTTVERLIPEGLGDWCPPYQHWCAPTPFVTTAWHVQNLRLGARIAEVLGDRAHAARYAAAAEDAIRHINAKYLATTGRARGAYYDDRRSRYQTTQAAALAFGIVPEELRADAQKELLISIRECYGHLDVGIQGLRVMLRELSRMGRADLAFSMLTQPSGPSFVDWSRGDGATSLHEHFQSSSSLNHIMFGDFAAWAYQHLAGIRLTAENGPLGLPDPAEPGFKTFVIMPEPIAALDFVEAKTECPYGTIRSAWRREGGAIVYRVTVPSGTTATFAAPGIAPKKLSAGDYEFKGRTGSKVDRRRIRESF